MDTTTLTPKLLKEKPAREALGGIGRTQFWNLIWTGQLRSVKIGRCVYVPQEALDEFIHNLPSASKADRDASRATV